jgi:hypothetical protein
MFLLGSISKVLVSPVRRLVLLLARRTFYPAIRLPAPFKRLKLRRRGWFGPDKSYVADGVTSPDII